MLEVRSLTKNFGALRASDGIDFDVAEGETHAVIGPNGAGKTTFISQLAGNLRPDAGTRALRRRGHHRACPRRGARAWASRARSRSPASIPSSARCDNVALAVQAHSGHSFRFWRTARGDAALVEPARAACWRKSALLQRKNILAANLAHGEQRQLEVAMALATGPRLLLLDEPMAGMGTEESQRMIALLAEAQAEARPSSWSSTTWTRCSASPTASRCWSTAASSPPTRPSKIKHERGSAQGLPGRGRRDARGRATCETAYGRSQVLFGISPRDRQRRGRDPARPQRHGQDHHRALDHGHHAGRAPAPSPSKAGRFNGLPSYRIAQAGLGLVPEGRQVFPNLTVRENLVATARKGAVDAGTRLQAVSAPGSAQGQLRQPALRRRAADARHRPRADDQPAPADPRRGDRGPRAADPRRDLPLDRAA